MLENVFPGVNIFTLELERISSADTVTQINYQCFVKNRNCFLVDPCLSVFTEVQGFLRLADVGIVRERDTISLQTQSQISGALIASCAIVL